MNTGFHTKPDYHIHMNLVTIRPLLITSVKLKVSAYFFCNLTAPNTPKWIRPQFFVGGCKKPSHLGSTCSTFSDCPCISAKSSILTNKFIRLHIKQLKKIPTPKLCSILSANSHKASWNAIVSSLMHSKQLVTSIKSKDIKMD